MAEISTRFATGFSLNFDVLALRRNITAGLPSALTMMAASLAGGVLVCEPLGSGYLAFGAAAGLTAALVGGLCACLVATNSMILWGPLVTIGLVQASFVTTLTTNSPLMNDPSAIITAVVVCTAVSGVFQLLFSLGGLAKIIKFTPQPVLSGFINGVSISIFASQIAPFVPKQWDQFREGEYIIHPDMLIFVIALVALNFWVGARNKKLPSQLICLVAGTASYHLFRLFGPGIDLGPTLGPLPIDFHPFETLSDGVRLTQQGRLWSILPQILLYAFATVVVGSFQSLLAFRMAENMAGAPISGRRGLAALGIGDVVSSLFGGFAITVAAPMTVAAFRNGGRTRAVGITVSVTLIFLVVLLPTLLSQIPRAVIVALLFIVSVSAFDRSSVQSLVNILTRKAIGQRVYYDLIVVAIIMAMTLMVSIVPAILIGFAAACITFAIDMSRPIVRRRLVGLRSKRVRTGAEGALLRQSSERWIALRLSGVLFFGNCEALAHEALGHVNNKRFLILDCRGITDIDASGSNILYELANKYGKQGRLLFCGLAASFCSLADRLVKSRVLVFPDLDSALEHVESQIIAESPESRAAQEPLSVKEHDFVKALDSSEQQTLRSLLVKREFARGAILASEGEPGDRMWLILKGCVDILLRADDHCTSRRIASLGAGTTVGEMSLIEDTHRSATIVAADDVLCCELNHASYQTLLRDNPKIAIKLLSNLIVELARCVRNTSEQLREAET